MKANILFERFVQPLADFDYSNFIYHNLLPDGVDSELYLPVPDPNDPNKTTVPIGIINLQTYDRFAEDVEIYWRKWDGDDKYHVPNILRRGFDVPNSYYDSQNREVKTVPTIILRNTINNQNYEFKARVLDLYGNKSAWSPSITQVMDQGTSTSVGQNYLEETGAGWSADVHAGRVLIDSGGAEYKISSNTSARLTIQANGKTPKAGAFKIVKDKWLVITCGDTAGPHWPYARAKLLHTGTGYHYP